VLDSVPSKMYWYMLCQSRVNPQSNLPVDCRSWFLVTGPRDRIIGDSGVQLAELATSQCGAVPFVDKRFGHIFKDSAENTELRLDAGMKFLKDALRRRLETR
jgi:hypothetical protein